LPQTDFSVLASIWARVQITPIFVAIDLHVLGEELGMLLKLPNEGRYGERFCRWQTGYKHEQLDRKYACCCTQRKLALRSRTASDPLTARLRKAWLDPARA
jgi:hypothetical protein